jgi:hypothetical protein
LIPWKRMRPSPSSTHLYRAQVVVGLNPLQDNSSPRGDAGVEVYACIAPYLRLWSLASAPSESSALSTAIEKEESAPPRLPPTEWRPDSSGSSSASTPRLRHDLALGTPLLLVIFNFIFVNLWLFVFPLITNSKSMSLKVLGIWRTYAVWEARFYVCFPYCF